MIPATEANLFVANSGTTMRFLTALVCLGHGRFRLDGVPRMRERPIERSAGCPAATRRSACSEGDNGCPPVCVEADGLPGGRVLHQGRCQQPVPQRLAHGRSVRTRVTWRSDVDGPLVSAPYVDMTVTHDGRLGVRRVARLARAAFLCPGHGRTPGRWSMQYRDRAGCFRRQLFLGRGRHHRRPCRVSPDLTHGQSARRRALRRRAGGNGLYRGPR